MYMAEQECWPNWMPVPLGPWLVSVSWPVVNLGKNYTKSSCIGALIVWILPAMDSGLSHELSGLSLRFACVRGHTGC